MLTLVDVELPISRGPPLHEPKYELHISKFLRDVLSDEIEFTVVDDVILIYRIKSPGITEQITIDEFIYFMQYDIIKLIRQSKQDIMLKTDNLVTKVKVHPGLGPLIQLQRSGMPYHGFPIIQPPQPQRGQVAPNQSDIELDKVYNRLKLEYDELYRGYHLIDTFEKLFGMIDPIKRAVKHMKILLTYEPTKEEEEGEDESDEIEDTSNIIKEVSTKRFERP
jgi:hypothetical protein